MYDIKREVIFTHFPKTGGTTIEAAFQWHPNTNSTKHENYLEHFKKFKHALLEDHIKELSEMRLDHKKFFKFTCIRNPWDIMVSRFFHDRMFCDSNHIKSLCFDDYVSYRLKNKKWLDVSPFIMHQNEYQMNFVIRYENYKQDSEKIFKQFGVDWPLENYNTKSRPPNIHYRDLFTNMYTIDSIKNAAKSFIELYGYEF
jgi:hypothetical protein